MMPGKESMFYAPAHAGGLEVIGPLPANDA
jgi:hypothetical protein